jgi:hypothetical protein
MKLLYQGPLWSGSTSLQRFEAFAGLAGVVAIPLDTGARPGPPGSLYRRIRWKLRYPVDALDENAALLAAVVSERPLVVVIDALQPAGRLSAIGTGLFFAGEARIRIPDRCSDVDMHDQSLGLGFS